MKINEKLLKSLEVAGCHEWTTMKEWSNNHPASYRIMKKAGIHKVIADELNLRYPDLNKRKEEHRSFVKKYGRFPVRNSSNPTEKRLYSTFKSFCSPSCKNYDPDFHAWAKSLGYGVDRSGISKEQIRSFFEKTGRMPNQRSTNPTERSLGNRLASYCSSLSNCYDEEFKKWARKNGYRRVTK